LELFSLEEKVALLPGGLFVCAEVFFNKRMHMNFGYLFAQGLVLTSAAIHVELDEKPKNDFVAEEVDSGSRDIFDDS